MRAAVRDTIPRISSISSSANRFCRLGISATDSSTSSGFKLDRQAISNSSRRTSVPSSRGNASDMRALAQLRDGGLVRHRVLSTAESLHIRIGLLKHARELLLLVLVVELLLLENHGHLGVGEAGLVAEVVAQVQLRRVLRVHNVLRVRRHDGRVAYGPMSVEELLGILPRIVDLPPQGYSLTEVTIRIEALWRCCQGCGEELSKQAEMIPSAATSKTLHHGAARRLQTAQRRTFAAPGGAGGIAGNKISGIVRFYKKVGVNDVQAENGSATYAVTLDGKTVKTPMRTPLQLPIKSMAVAVAQEWDAQEERIKPALMPIMALASTALDLEKTSSKEDLVNEMLHYLNSDTLCYQVTADQQEKLAVLQQKKWDPIRKWFVEQFEGELDVAHGSIGRLTHDESIIGGIRQQLLQRSEFELVPLRAITKECKSLITAWALYKRHITAKEAMDISRVEEEFQIGRWGLVEGGHDLDRVNCSVNLASASFFLWLQQNQV